MPELVVVEPKNLTICSQLIKLKKYFLYSNKLLTKHIFYIHLVFQLVEIKTFYLGFEDVVIESNNLIHFQFIKSLYLINYYKIASVVVTIKHIN